MHKSSKTLLSMPVSCHLKLTNLYRSGARKKFYPIEKNMGENKVITSSLVQKVSKSKSLRLARFHCFGFFLFRLDRRGKTFFFLYVQRMQWTKHFPISLKQYYKYCSRERMLKMRWKEKNCESRRVNENTES